MATFNGRLRQLMKENGFTQHKLAEAVDVSEPSVYSYYHGFTTPRLDVLVVTAIPSTNLSFALKSSKPNR